MDAWYLNHLVCPRDASELKEGNGDLTCVQGHSYPVVAGVPVMLRDDVAQTLWVAAESLKEARAKMDRSELFLGTMPLGENEKNTILSVFEAKNSPVDAVVPFLVAATNGVLYKPLTGNLRRYPIPHFPLLHGNGRHLLDVGCNWGRWSISAAKSGWAVVGIDPSLGAVMTARRVAQSMDLSMRFVVADARFLPFPAREFDAVFSYSVLQHFSKKDVAAVASEISRVLKPDGLSMIQMPNRWGLRSVYQQVRRWNREVSGFDVRYWPIPELTRLFSKTIGDTRISIDCFGGLGIQRADWDLMSTTRKLVIGGSEAARFLGKFLPVLRHVADSVYVTSMKSEPKNALN